MDIIRNLSNQLVKIIKKSCPPSREAANYDCIANDGCDKNSIIKVEIEIKKLIVNGYLLLLMNV